MTDWTPMARKDQPVTRLDDRRALYATWALATTSVLGVTQFGVAAAQRGADSALLHGLCGALVGAAVMSATVVANQLGTLSAVDDQTYPEHEGANGWSPALDLGTEELDQRRAYRAHRAALRRMAALRTRRLQIVADRYPKGFTA